MKMPDLATTASSIRILKWLKKPGDAVKRGEAVLEIETDKAAMEVEATVTGVFREAKAPEGAEVSAGDVIALIDAPEAPVAAAPAATPAAAAVKAQAAAAPRAGAKGLFARNRAAAAGEALSLAELTAARRLAQSKQTIPHFYVQSSANAKAVIALRKAALPSRLVWDAFFVKAAAAALGRFGKMALRFENDARVPQGTTRIGVAADVGGELYVISVDEPGSKDVAQISREIEASVEAIGRGDPEARRIKPGVMTISNLGSTGIEAFSAIINPPESCILAVGAAKPVLVPEGASFVAQDRLSLTLSVDHRVASGRYAADFLQAIVGHLESP